MRVRLLVGLMLAPAVVALISCAGEEDERNEVEGFVTINAVTAPMYRATPALSGSRYTSAHTVNWRTDAGASGSANLTLQRNCVAFPIPFVFPECNHAWNASIPLVVGTNTITVIGFGDDGDWGQAAITITRLACPPQFVPEACS